MRPAILYRLLLVIMATLPASACLGGSPRPTLPSAAAGCPAILLTRSGGLGFESQSGVIAAVWPSGAILRAASAAGPSSGHFIGSVSNADRTALMELAQSSRIWDQPRGEVVLDSPDDTLTLRRNGTVRQWAETPGFTTTPVVSEFRSRLFAVSIEDAKRVRGPFDDVLNCINQPLAKKPDPTIAR